jgi:nicotinate-nucleotide adenylyltransferase
MKSGDTMSKPIGVLGGIFDPVHNGHLATGMLAYDFFNLDKVVFIPAGIPPHKAATVTAPSNDRLKMLEIALEGEVFASIWEREVHTTEVSYTIDTLEELAAVYPDAPLYFIVGSDNLNEIHTWHRYRDILSLVTLCVTERPGYSMEIPSTLSSAKIETFPSPLWGVSSTLLRSYLSQGYRCNYLIPDGVREYINTKGLYRFYEQKKAKSLCKQK